MRTRRISVDDYTDIGGRENNEDSKYYNLPGNETLLAVLADGLGGHGGGEIASKLAVDIVKDGWKGVTKPEDLENLAKQANEAVLARQSTFLKMKTTLVILSLNYDCFQYAWVGDSRLYYFHNGKRIWQTKDHSASQIAVMMGDITEDQIRFHEDRSRLYRAVGLEGEFKCDFGQQEIKEGLNAFLLCSDGFWEYIREEEMEEALYGKSSPKEWLMEMREIINKRVQSDNDNNTAIVVFVEK